MSQFLDNMKGGCHGHCHECALLDDHVNPSPAGGWSGGRLALAATGIFLLPVLTAMAGACVCHGPLQAAGGLAGLAGGMLLAGPLTRLIPRNREEHDARSRC